MNPEIVSDLLVAPDEAQARLQVRLERIADVRSNNLDHVTWFDDTITELDAIFASKASSYFLKEGGFSFVYAMNRGRQFRGANLDRTVGILKRMIETIGKTVEPSKRSQNNLDSKKIFIVHGHDEALKEKVSAVLRRLKLDPVVLNEQANQGLSILEKIEKHGAVGFAVVLFTSDDLGASKADHANAKYDERPRQNVVLELGYFWGKLGRDRVCLLNGVGDALASDLKGLGYTSILNGDAWKFELVRELKAAGYSVDANDLI